MNVPKKPFWRRFLKPGVILSILGFFVIIVYVIALLHNRSIKIFHPTEIEHISSFVAGYVVAIIVASSLIVFWFSVKAPSAHRLTRFMDRHRVFATFVEVVVFALVFFGGFFWLAASIDITGITDFSGGFAEPGFGVMGRSPNAMKPIRISWSPALIVFGFVICTILFRSLRQCGIVVMRILFDEERLTIRETTHLGLTYLLIFITYAVLFMAADGRLFTVAVFDSVSGQIRYWYGLALVGLEGPVGLLDYFYFSLSTISTLGYGDIHPLSPLAKMLSMSEALMGTVSFALIVGSVMKGIMGKKTET